MHRLSWGLCLTETPSNCRQKLRASGLKCSWLFHFVLFFISYVIFPPPVRNVQEAQAWKGCGLLSQVLNDATGHSLYVTGVAKLCLQACCAEMVPQPSQLGSPSGVRLAAQFTCVNDSDQCLPRPGDARSSALRVLTRDLFRVRERQEFDARPLSESTLPLRPRAYSCIGWVVPFITRLVDTRHFVMAEK